MEKYIFSILIALLTLPVFAQKQAQAKLMLDKTAAAFEKAGGVQADFTVEAFNKGGSLGKAIGNIKLKGEKFLLKTSETISWFDGETQWSYLTQNDEVNISTPTEEELQGMNPYALLYLYKALIINWELKRSLEERPSARLFLLQRIRNRIYRALCFM